MKKVFAIAVAALFTVSAMAQTAQPTATPKPAVKKERKQSPEQYAQRKAELLQSQLGLSPEQTKQVTTAMNVRNSALKSIHAKTGADKEAFRKEAKASRVEFQNKLKAILGPDQLKKFQEMRKANRRTPDGASDSKKADLELEDESEMDKTK